MTPLPYRDTDGARHEVAVHETADGDWQVLDTCAAETRVIETLDGRIDGRPTGRSGRARLRDRRTLYGVGGARVWRAHT